MVRRFRDFRALVIGDAMLDSYLEGSATRLCREGPVPVVKKTAEEHAPGGAANAAANLRALGAQVTFIGLLGRDLPGSLLRGALRERGVDDRWLVEDDSVSTLHKQRILSDDQYVVRFDSGDTRRSSAEARERLLANLEETFPRCDLVVVSDYLYGSVTDELIERLRELRSGRPCVLAVDSKDLARYRNVGATVITPNHLEAQLAADRTAAEDGDVDLDWLTHAGRRLLVRTSADWAAITLAADGVLLFGREGAASHFPAHPVPRANDVGAGDSFTAAMALALAAGADAPTAAQIGVDAGSIAVLQRRTAVVEHQELLRRVSRSLYSPRGGQGDSPSNLRALADRLEGHRRAGHVIVFSNGVFDILHAGHVHLLRQARALGDVLVVGVNSDRSARRLKGKNRPIIGQDDRLALVAALDSVDHVILFDEDDPGDVIRALRPHLHVKGGDYAGETLPEAEAVYEVGGRVVVLPLAIEGPGHSGRIVREQRPYSTTNVIDRILTLTAGDSVLRP